MSQLNSHLILIKLKLMIKIMIQSNITNKHGKFFKITKQKF